jgi:two-component system chemotaxis response regulator CheY
MPRLLSIGQCALDALKIRWVLQGALKAEVVAADTFADAAQALGTATYDLVLVNRVTDLDGSSGLDFIRQFKADPATAAVPVMLISDRAEAQREAETLGALPGVGKAAMGSSATRERLRAAIESAGRPLEAE